MFILHIALGGCLTAEPMVYGVTPDTGGHIGYVLAAATAQQDRDDVEAVEILTRRFDEPTLPDRVRAECDDPLTPITGKLRIRRFASRSRRYLSKEALRSELPDIEAAIEAYLAGLPRLPQVIHAHFADAAMVGLRLRTRFGIPLIYTPHSLAADKPAALDATARRRMADERRALARADVVIVSSRDEGERQVGHYAGAALARVRQIRPGCDLVPGNPADALPLLAGLRDPGLPMILAIARPVAKKNLVALAEAYAGAARLRRRANLVVLAGQRLGAGWGSTEERAQITAIRRLLDAHPDCAALPAQHSRDEARALYAHAAAVGGIFVNPALVEPFGLTTLEAARAGLPCVVPQRGGAAEVAAALGHGVAVDTRDIAALRRSMLQMLQPDAYAKAARAAAKAAPTLGWAGYAEALQRVILSLVRPTVAGPAGIESTAGVEPAEAAAASADMNRADAACADAAREGASGMDFARGASTPSSADLPAGGRGGILAASATPAGHIASPRVAVSGRETLTRHLLVCDLDGTLTGDRDGAARFSDLIRSGPSIRFAIATGRSISEAWRVLDDWSLPRPEALITSAGSEIYRPAGPGGPALDRGYGRAIAKLWRPDRIAALLADLPDVAPQADIEQRRWKLGYIGCARGAAAMRARLMRAGLQATVVHSHGTLIDVMPAGVTKRAAVAHLADRLGVPAGDVIVAGDSGNDLAMLTGGWNAVVIGRDPDLAALPCGPRLYRPAAAHADGVIEGFSHYAARTEVCAA